MMRNHKKSLWSGSNDEITIIQLFPAIYIRWVWYNIFIGKKGCLWSKYEHWSHIRGTQKGCEVSRGRTASKVGFKWNVDPWYRDNIMGTTLRHLVRLWQSFFQDSTQKIGGWEGRRYSWISPLMSWSFFFERLTPKLTIIIIGAVFRFIDLPDQFEFWHSRRLDHINMRQQLIDKE